MEWTHVVIHHSCCVNNHTASWEEILAHHTSWRYNNKKIDKEEGKRFQAQGIKDVEPPWIDIGYHAGIELINNSYTIRIGRNVGLKGKHCSQMDDTALGFVFIGNYNVWYPDPVMLDYAALFLAAWLIAFDIPVENVIPHGMLCQSHNCPGELFDMEYLRDAIEEAQIPK